jgi:hypothetical protein
VQSCAVLGEVGGVLWSNFSWLPVRTFFAMVIAWREVAQELLNFFPRFLAFVSSDKFRFVCSFINEMVLRQPIEVNPLFNCYELQLWNNLTLLT